MRDKNFLIKDGIISFFSVTKIYPLENPFICIYFCNY